VGGTDALIVVAAAASGCAIVYSEDLNPGQTIQGVRIENPFAQARVGCVRRRCHRGEAGPARLKI
jgi:hypothetical protein